MMSLETRFPKCMRQQTEIIAHKKYKYFQLQKVLVGNRVTRLGEFSPNGFFFTLGSFMKITEVARICYFLISTVKVMH
jgi:hypothetical protein